MDDIVRLIDDLLSGSLSDETRADLEDMRRQAEDGTLDAADAKYIRGLHRRLGGAIAGPTSSLSEGGPPGRTELSPAERDALALLGLPWPATRMQISQRWDQLMDRYRGHVSDGDPTAWHFLDTLQQALDVVLRCPLLPEEPGPSVPTLPPTEREALRLLGLAWPTTQVQIQDRYGDLVKRYQPDASSGDPTAEHLLNKIEAAYALLTQSSAVPRQL